MRISDWSSDVCSSDLGSLEDLQQGALVALLDRVDPGLLVDQVQDVDQQHVPDRIVADPDRARRRGDDAAQHRQAVVVGEGQRDGDEAGVHLAVAAPDERSEEPTSELQSLMRISYAVFCLKKRT